MCCDSRETSPEVKEVGRCLCVPLNVLRTEDASRIQSFSSNLIYLGVPSLAKPSMCLNAFHVDIHTHQERFHAVHQCAAQRDSVNLEPRVTKKRIFTTLSNNDVSEVHNVLRPLLDPQTEQRHRGGGDSPFLEAGHMT